MADDGNDIRPPQDRTSRRSLLKLMGATGAAGAAYLAGMFPEVAAAAPSPGRSRLPRLTYRASPAGTPELPSAELTTMRGRLTAAGLDLVKAEQGEILIDGAQAGVAWTGQYRGQDGSDTGAYHVVMNTGVVRTFAFTPTWAQDGSLHGEMWTISLASGSFELGQVVDLSADRTTLRVRDLASGKTAEFRARAGSAVPTGGGVRVAEASTGCDFCQFICNTVATVGCGVGITVICSAACGPVFWGCAVPCAVIAGALCGTLQFVSCIDACVMLGYC